MTTYRNRRVQGGSALAHLPLHMQGRTSRLVSQIAVVSQSFTPPTGCFQCCAAGPLACGAAQNLTSKLAQFLAMSGGEGGSRSGYWGLFFPVFRRIV